MRGCMIFAARRPTMLARPNFSWWRLARQDPVQAAFRGGEPAGVVVSAGRRHSAGWFWTLGGAGSGGAGSCRRRTSTTCTPKVCSRARSPCRAA
jgi:hypothetical protein